MFRDYSAAWRISQMSQIANDAATENALAFILGFFAVLLIIIIIICIFNK